MYRLHSDDSRGPAVTKTLSVSNGRASPAPVITELTRSDQQLHQADHHADPAIAGHWRPDMMYRGSHGYNIDMLGGGGMSHSFTLPHSMSHHSSKFS